ncbi:Nuclear envelope integral membrane protein 1 [Lucilia cuprina]|nr:Nuclear envelope integral membrane protein 1 [Lucilia cuprina]
MSINNYVILCCLVAVVSAAELVDKNKNDQANLGGRVTYLEAGEIHIYEPLRRHRGFFEKDLRTYCYRGEHKTLGRLFETVELITSDDYTQYDGATPAEVQEHYDEHRSLFSFNLFSQKRTRLQLSPFASSCMGIETIEPYRIRLQKVRVDFWRVIQLVVGCLVFHYAGKLSQNAVFYYITGVALGICSSFMLLIWLSSKLVPRRTMMYGVLIGGWTIGLYVIQMLWENLQVIILTYRTYVFWYIFVTGVVSFFFCYRWGPPTNQRSKNIIKWLLQLMSLIMIYFSSRYEEATAAIIILTIILHYFPRSLWYKGRAFWLRKFPPKRRFLTNEEYYEQGVRETTKALDELRSFASSPDCNQWRVMSKLRDPMRFAAFVEGASHLRDEEILHFESSKYSDDLDDSDISLNDSDEEDVSSQIIQQHHVKTNYNGQQQLNTVGDISEDEEDVISEEDEENMARGRATPLQRYHITHASNSATISSAKQRLRHITPTTRARHSSAPRSVTRSSRLYEQEFSDEG